MKAIIVDGTANEIADLVIAVQNRQNVKVCALVDETLKEAVQKEIESANDEDYVY